MLALVGVIIGSLISFLGIIYTEHIKIKTIKVEQKYHHEKYIFENKQRIYKQFLELTNKYQDYLNANLINYKNYASEEDKIILLKSISSVLSEMDLFATKEISSACRNIYYSALNMIFDRRTFKLQYDKAVELLQNDLKNSDFT